MYVVTGITGHTGSIVANTLLDQGKPVRVVTRQAVKAAAFAARGAEVVVADLQDSAALTKAFKGATAAWVLIPPNLTVEDFTAYQSATVDSVVTATRDASLAHIVLLSSIGADKPSGTGPIAGLFRAEAKLAALSGTAHSFVRAAYFMENLGMSLSLLDNGLVTSFFPKDFALPMVATPDIGKLGASLMVEGPSPGGLVEISGPAISMNDVAASLSKLVGKPIQVAEAPLDAMVPTLTSFGLSTQMASLYHEMTAAMIAGTIVPQPGIRRVNASTTVDQVLGKLLAGK